VRKKQRKTSLNELFIIGKRENTTDRLINSSAAKYETPVSEKGTTDAKDTVKEEEEQKENENKQVEDHEETKEEEKDDKEDEEDFIIVFKYGGKAYRCSEKEKSILERQVKVLDPSTFQMLLDDFQLEVFAVLDQPQQVDTPAPANNESDSRGEEGKSEDEDEESDEDGEKDEEEAEGDGDEDKKEEGVKFESGNKNRRRRRRRARKRKAGGATPQASEGVLSQKSQSGQGVELGGRVWTKSPSSPFSPSKRTNRLAEKNNTMRDTMRKRMQLAYEEEVTKRGGEQRLQWKRERKAGSQLAPSRKNAQ
jgi:hypothetical protein